MKWIEFSKQLPVINEYIWVWDVRLNEKTLIRYVGELEIYSKDRPVYPIWAALNEEE